MFEKKKGGEEMKEYVKICLLDATGLEILFVKPNGYDHLNKIYGNHYFRFITTEVEFHRFISKLACMINNKNGITQDRYEEIIYIMKAYINDGEIEINNSNNIMDLLREDKIKALFPLLITSNKDMIDKAKLANVSVWNSENGHLKI